MKKANTYYTVTELCTLFKCNERTYYAQIRPKFVNQQELTMITAIKALAIETGNIYGRRRMHISLQNQGFKLGTYKTATLMKKAHVVAITPRKKHYYPNGGTTHAKVMNILDRQFSKTKSNTHWVGDITYVRTHQGWSYLACVLDLATKEIVGWAMSKIPGAELVKTALCHAIGKQQPRTNQLLFHSDQGTQYSSKLFVNYLEKLNITQSMSRRGNCWDNSVMERFFRSLKSERLNHVQFINHDSAKQCVDSYIYFYNYKRLHSALGYITPVQKRTILRNVA